VTYARVPSDPMGADVQVFPAAALAWIDANIADPAVREHVSLYFYEHPEKYRIVHMMAPPQWHLPQYRLQLDYPEDLAFIRQVYARLEPEFGSVFGLEAIASLLRAAPELLAINGGCEEKAVR
jgi:spore coat polysaccharide biosynthesis protein SpsF